jgi:hypothetical protein
MESSRVTWLAAAMTLLMALAVFAAGPAYAGTYDRKSKEHEAACNKWCAENKPDCDHCSPMSGCGSGYDTIKSWTGRGKNWHACKRRLSRDQATEAKKKECKTWCDRNPDCEYCSTVGCKSGMAKMRKWAGRGKNVVACGKKQYRSEASNRNRDDCYKWCEEHKDICSNCSKTRGCAAYRVRLKTWGGKGKNFYACGSTKKIKAKNKADCNAWCKANSGCVKCSHKKGCGLGYKRIKSFSLGGSSVDYHACKKN